MNNIDLNEKYVFITKNGWGDWKVQSIHSTSSSASRAMEEYNVTHPSHDGWNCQQMVIPLGEYLKYYKG